MNMAPARYESLDAIRGVAVMGILAMNIIAFALPFSAYTNPMAGGPIGNIDLATWFFTFVFVDSKMRGLFSMLFGASTLLVIQSAAASGRSAAGAHYSRMFWLAIFGLIHFYFIWFGDILFLYAICGLLLFAFRNLSIRALVVWAVVFLVTGIGFLGMGWLMFSLAEAGRLPAEGAAQIRSDLVQLNADMGPNAASYAKEITLHLGSYGSIVAEKLGERLSEPLVSALMFLWETMGLMLIGMALFKSRMLTGEWEAARYRKWALTGFLIGIPPLVGLAWYQYADGFGAVSTFGASLSLSAPFDIAMTIGWAALIMLLIKTAASDRVRARLAATGRMAFTNYLVTSIVMTTIFYGYGLGLYGSVGRTALYLFCFAMWAAMLLWSKPWLDRFNYGPLEWIWRSLSRWRLQPMRKLSGA
ncbi:uncharacterized protein SAMN05428974_0843 [Sphingopyxis sp. YR583]|uniref:DUF418 domain-containing protein n=1 Tax=Sphingopyxis sp. YR583 TaxID=1881047 RepID=UPI0008A7D646|nr:DUF418 domain-containing protein [Sphingopyxis sp. YR583]SEH13610.1 uncharacterized protein SAMN05428974_0843 [Sphingopyxis sp. YR583]